ncbi:MAG: helix-turn-helix domain-containing protein, partial [Blautia sp.]|uniref:helix-turn-helix domain-containing protein n=1 Tax=Blautia sp. TaxID=1955243 RepID=UPI0025C6E290
CGSWTAYEIMNKFKDDIIIIDYWKRLPAEVFWKWYEGQNRYRTKEDRDRDKEIESATMSMPEMARALGVTRSKIYGILRNPKYAEHFELVIVADRKRYTKEGFEKFLASQDEYKRPVKKKTKKVEKDSDQKPVQEDSFTKVRETVKLDSSSVLTLDQAAAMAGVAKATVSKWCSKRYFPNVKQGKVVRIPAETYKEWLRIYRDWEG